MGFAHVFFALLPLVVLTGCGTGLEMSDLNPPVPVSSTTTTSSSSSTASTSSEQAASMSGAVGTYVKVPASPGYVVGGNVIYTVEFFFRGTVVTGTPTLYSDDVGFTINIDGATQKIIFNFASNTCNGAASGGGQLNNSVVISANTNHHVAVVWDNQAATEQVFIDGTASVTGGGLTVMPGGCTVTNIYLGTNKGTSNWFNGSIDSVRISNNARYTGAYTVPTTKLTSDANTVLLLNFNNGTSTVDYSSIGASLSFFGAAALISSPFF